MGTLSATMIFWFLMLGVTTGWVLGYIVGHEGITLRSNIVWGGASAILIGVIALLLNFSGGALLYSFMGTLAMLFIANVFHLHHVEDIKGDIDRRMQIKRRR